MPVTRFHASIQQAVLDFKRLYVRITIMERLTGQNSKAPNPIIHLAESLRAKPAIYSHFAVHSGLSKWPAQSLLLNYHPISSTGRLTVPKIHRMKGLQKERVPINIEVEDNNKKGTFNDGRSCPSQYTHKSSGCNHGGGRADPAGRGRDIHPAPNQRDRVTIAPWSDPGAG
jgi:hypothetical protein